MAFVTPKTSSFAKRLERNRVVQNLFRVFKRRFVNVADLIRVHKTRVAHHIAAVRQINGQNRAAPEFNVRSSVMMNVLVFGSFEIAPVK